MNTELLELKKQLHDLSLKTEIAIDNGECNPQVKGFGSHRTVQAYDFSHYRIFRNTVYVIICRLKIQTVLLLSTKVGNLTFFS